MNLSTIYLNEAAARRLVDIAQWHDTTPETMAKLLLEEATREIWAHHGHTIQEMRARSKLFT